MATTQLVPNNYRLRNAQAFVNSFSSTYVPFINASAAAFTTTLSLGSNQLPVSGAPTGIALGQTLTSNVTLGIPAGTTVVSVNSSYVVMSTPATNAGSAAVNSYSQATSSYYVFAGQSTPWPGGVVPQYYDNTSTVNFNTYNNMLFGKAVTPSDVSLMTDAYPWLAGDIYAMYDDADPNLSNKQFYVYTTDTLYYYVWKCLYNNNGAKSNFAPQYSDTHAADLYYQTSDGYQWKYMYRFPLSTYNKFATANYIPVVPDANVYNAANTVNGAVDVIVPVDGNGNIVITTGSGYNNYYSGTLANTSVQNITNPVIQLDSAANKSNNFYYGCIFYVNGGSGAGQYKRIIAHYTTGNGTYVVANSIFTTNVDNTSTFLINPAVNVYNSGDNVANVTAIALVNAAASNSVYQIQMLNRGSGVLSATANVYASPQVGVSNTAVLRVIAGPKGGHGSNAAAELYASAVGVSVTFSNTESNTIPTYGQDYQTVGLLANPLFANVTFTTTGQSGIFQANELVTQTISNTTASAVVTSASPLQVTNATAGFVVSPNSSYGLITGAKSGATAQVTGFTINGVKKGFRTFVQYYTYNGGPAVGLFNQNEVITASNVALGYVCNATFFANNSTGTQVYVTNKIGPIYYPTSTTIPGITGSTSGATFSINTGVVPDLVPESGDIVYIENFSAVTRPNTNTQNETIKLILQY